VCRPHGGRQGVGRYPDRMQTTSYFTPHALAHGARSRGCFTCINFLGQFSMLSISPASAIVDVK